jgi:hypothetical protein
MLCLLMNVQMLKYMIRFYFNAFGNRWENVKIPSQNIIYNIGDYLI